MAAAYQAAGAAQAALGGTDLTVPWPTHAVGDIALLWVQRCNETITLSTPAGFTLITGSAAGTAGSNNSQNTNVYWCRATSTSMTSPVVSNPLSTAANSYAIARITTYRGCLASGDPTDTSNQSSDTSANTSYTIPAVTTSTANCLIVLCCAGTRDNATSSCANDFTNANLTGIGNYNNCSTAGGNGGNINTADGTKVTAGGTGTTTGTFTAGTSQTKGLLTVALKPALVVSGGNGTGVFNGVFSGFGPIFC